MHALGCAAVPRVEVILRQYGYKGLSPTLVPGSALEPSPIPPTVVEHEEDEIHEIVPSPEVRRRRYFNRPAILS